MDALEIPIDAYFRRPMTAIGVRAMEQISLMHVLVVGLRGSGMEIAKCLALSGVQRLTLMDEELVRNEDLALGFLLREGDQGKPKAKLVAARLNALAPFADVRTLNGTLSLDLLLNFHVVVFASVSLSLEELIAYDEFCRAQDPPIGVVVAESRGLFGSVFTDFSRDHQSLNTTPNSADAAFTVVHNRTQVHDDGHVDRISVTVKEPLLQVLVEPGDHMTLQASGTDREPLLLMVEDITSNAEVRLRPIVTGSSRREIQAQLHSQFTVLKRVESRVFATAHRSLRECALSPGLVALPAAIGDDDRGRGNSLHMAGRAVHQFRRAFGVLPNNNNADHIQYMLTLIDDHLNKNAFCERPCGSTPISICREDVDNAFIARALRCASSEFLPLSALIAGYAALQVLKFSGALGPLLHPPSQFLCFDIIDLAREETNSSLLPRDSSFAAIFGDNSLERLRETQLVFIGTGSVNMELLKNIRCCGIGSARLRFVLDPDECATIKADDLHDCALFMPSNVGNNKVSVFTSSPNATIVSPLKDGDLTTLPWELWTESSAIVADVSSTRSLLAIDDSCLVFEKPTFLTYEDSTGLQRSDVVVPHTTATFCERFISPGNKPWTGVFAFDQIPTPSRPNNARVDAKVLVRSERIVESARRCFERMFQSAIDVAVQYAECRASSKMGKSDDGIDDDEEDRLWVVWSVVQRGYRADTFGDCLRVAWLLLELLPLWMGSYVSSKLESTVGQREQDDEQHSRSSAILELNASDPDQAQLLVATACIIATSVHLAIPPVESRRAALAQVSIDSEAFSLHRHPRTPSSIRASFAEIDASQLKPIVGRVQRTELDLDDVSKGHLHFLQSLANLQLAWSGSSASRVATLPQLRRLCRAKRGFLPITTILGALKALQLVQVLLQGPAADVGEFSASTTATGSRALVTRTRPPTPLVAASMPYEVTRGVPLRVIPEESSKWTKIIVPTSPALQSVKALAQFVETKFHITVHAIFYRERCVATVDAQTPAALDGPLTQSVFDLCETSALFVVLDVVAVDAQGDVALAPLRVNRIA